MIIMLRHVSGHLAQELCLSCFGTPVLLMMQRYPFSGQKTADGSMHHDYYASTSQRVSGTVFLFQSFWHSRAVDDAAISIQATRYVLPPFSNLWTPIPNLSDIWHLVVLSRVKKLPMVRCAMIIMLRRVSACSWGIQAPCRLRRCCLRLDRVAHRAQDPCLGGHYCVLVEA